MFVDDIKVLGVKKSGHIKKIKQELVTAFEMVDMGQLASTWA